MGFLVRIFVTLLGALTWLGAWAWDSLTSEAMLAHLRTAWQWYAADPGHNTLALLLTSLTIWTAWELGVEALRQAVQMHRARKLVCLKITQPRQETNKDREEATEKDFHEKVALMEQLYRSLHEIGEMNLGNTIRSWLFQTDLVSFEVMYVDEKIQFFAVTHEYYRPIVEKQITSFYPDAYVEPVKELPDPAPAGKYAKAFYFYQKKADWRPFRTYKSLENDPLNAMTNVFSKLQPADRASVQMVIRPTGSGWEKAARKHLNNEMLKKEEPFFSIPGLGWLSTFLGVIVFGRDSDIGKLGTNQPGANGGDAYTVRDQATEENIKHIGEKISQPAFETVIRIVGASDSSAAAEQITNAITTAFGMFGNDYLNTLENRRMIFLDWLNNAMMLLFYRYRLPRQGVWPVHEKSCLLVPEELASIIHIPTSRYNYTPLIEWLKYKILPPPVNLPSEGVVLGKNLYRGEEKLVRIKTVDRTRHLYIIGKSGSGKSVLISQMAGQDIQNGDGVCVVDPHGDLIEDVLSYVPKERAKDVIVFNPADMERPMGINLLEANTPEEKDFASLAAMEIFIKLFGNEVFGPRLQHYFRNGCLTLMDDAEEGATLVDIPRLFTDDEFSQYKLTKVKNPVVRSFWEREMAKTGQREKEEMIPYFSAKFGPFVTNTMMRNIIGQKKSAFDFRKVMDERKILLVNLSKGAVGDLNSQLLGLIFVNKINMAAMGRVNVPEDQRPNFWLYVDEFQNFATDTFATILSEARKYHLGLTIAHQYIGQLTHKSGPEGGSGEDPTIRDAVFGNVGTMLNFKIGAADAEYMAKEYAPLLSEQDVVNIANYSAYIKLNIDNTTSRPFSMTTIYDPTAKNRKLAELIKEYSRLKYGRKREFVDAEVIARIGIDIPTDEQAATDAAFTPLPDELNTPPVAGAPVERVTPDHIAAVEASHIAAAAANPQGQPNPRVDFFNL